MILTEIKHQEEIKRVTRSHRMTIFNSMIRLRYFQDQSKAAQVIITLKAVPSPKEVTSYIPIEDIWKASGI